METKKVKEIYTDNLIALCHIIDSYSEFSKNLRSFISTKYNRDNVEYLYQMSNGKFIFGAKKVKQFYQKNKTIIDLINKYSNISMFINQHYDNQGNPYELADLDFFYQYILNKKDCLKQILETLNKIKKLGFEKLQFDENLDFTTNDYKINKSFKYNNNIEYLDNMEAIPNYESDVINYKTKGSNYKITIKPSVRTIINQDISGYDKKIIVNSLNFDANKLPEIMTKENTFDKIISLANEKNDECEAIRNSVNLSISLDFLCLSINSINNLLSRIDDIENKDDLLNILSEMKLNLNKLQTANLKYASNIEQVYPSITSDMLQEEKNLYLNRK